MALRLSAGPVLHHSFYDSDSEPAQRTREVTYQAAQYLYETVILDPDFTLDDLFELIRINPELELVFARDYAQELCAEAAKGLLPQSSDQGNEGVREIEYLELYRQWRLNTHDSSYEGVNCLALHGIGFPLEVDAPKYGLKAGERVKWSVSLTPLRELLDLPLRLQNDFDIVEDNLDAKAYLETLGRGSCTEVQLGQMIHATLWELSFHGTPEDQAQVSESLKEQLDEIEAGEIELIPHEDMFAELDKPGFSLMFESFGEVEKAEVRFVLREIPDDQPVGSYLDQAFNHSVRVRPEYRDLPAREFRSVFRTAGCSSSDADE